LAIGIAAAEPAPTAESRAHAYMTADPPDWASARAAFAEAADAGSPSAMSYLGWMYEEGHGVTADAGRAVQWYARAARAGAHPFAIKLGWMYLAGQGIEPDRATAEGWFRFAIDAGHHPANIALASVLISDALGGRDPQRVFEARELLESALGQGQSLASYFLARLFLEGVGSHPVDAERAVQYALVGADAGHAEAQGLLALMAHEGEGMDADPVLALKWASLAAAGGDRLGQQIRLELEDSLAPEQIAAGRAQAVDWAMARL
jgi:uncharacterized protein